MLNLIQHRDYIFNDFYSGIIFVETTKRDPAHFQSLALFCWPSMFVLLTPYPHRNQSASHPQVMIPSVKLDFSHVQAKCGSLDKVNYTASGGNVSDFNPRNPVCGVLVCGLITQTCLGLKHVDSQPVGGATVPLIHPDWHSCSSLYRHLCLKCRVFHQLLSICVYLLTFPHPQVQIQSKKIDLSHITSKCGSMSNIHHRPGTVESQLKLL